MYATIGVALEVCFSIFRKRNNNRGKHNNDIKHFFVTSDFISVTVH